jgi:hypothetical protein
MILYFRPRETCIEVIAFPREIYSRSVEVP